MFQDTASAAKAKIKMPAVLQSLMHPSKRDKKMIGFKLTA